MERITASVTTQGKATHCLLKTQRESPTGEAVCWLPGNHARQQRVGSHCVARVSRVVASGVETPKTQRESQFPGRGKPAVCPKGTRYANRTLTHRAASPPQLPHQNRHSWRPSRNAGLTTLPCVCRCSGSFLLLCLQIIYKIFIK